MSRSEVVEAKKTGAGVFCGALLPRRNAGGVEPQKICTGDPRGSRTPAFSFLILWGPETWCTRPFRGWEALLELLGGPLPRELRVLRRWSGFLLRASGNHAWKVQSFRLCFPDGTPFSSVSGIRGASLMRGRMTFDLPRKPEGPVSDPIPRCLKCTGGLFQGCYFL